MISAEASAGGCLIDEIERVSAKRERWRGYQADGVEHLSLGIALMTVAIDNGKNAIKRGDPIAAVRALEELRGFDEQD